MWHRYANFSSVRRDADFDSVSKDSMILGRSLSRRTGFGIVDSHRLASISAKIWLLCRGAAKHNLKEVKNQHLPVLKRTTKTLKRDKTNTSARSIGSPLELGCANDLLI